MFKGTIAALVILGLVIALSVATAGEEKEGVLQKLKSLGYVSGKKEKAPAKKEGEGLLEKVKKVLPGEKEKTPAKKEGKGMLQKVTDPMKKLIPGCEKK